MTTYPAQIDTTITLPTVVDTLSPVTGEAFNRLRNTIIVIEQELGINAKSNYSSVAERINTLETTVGNFQIISLAQDLGGTLSLPKVIGLQGKPVSSVSPSLNQVLTWDGLAWKAMAPQGGGGGTVTFAGDLTGTNSSQTVTGFQGRGFLSTAPSFHQTIAWNGSAWAPLTLTLDDFGPAFVIATFVGPALREVNQTIISPAFTATYSGSPTALTLTDADNNAPQSVIGTPGSFTSNYTFTKSTYGASVLFTLTATKNSTVKTATTTISWGQKLYWGVGAAGFTTDSDIQNLASSAVALTKAKTFQVTAGASDKIYFAYRSAYGAATFAVGGFVGGFALVSTTISVTNAYGFAENYTLYESDNLNLGTLTVVVS